MRTDDILKSHYCERDLNCFSIIFPVISTSVLAIFILRHPENPGFYNSETLYVSLPPLCPMCLGCLLFFPQHTWAYLLLWFLSP